MTQAAPMALDAEAVVLSACMLVPDAIVEVRSILTPDAFYADANRRIYEAILAEDDATGKVDATLVARRLRDSGRLPQVGGVQYLVQITEATPAVFHVAEHARTVAQKARMRRMIATCQRIAADGYGDVGDVDQWCNDAVGMLAQAADAALEDDTLTIASEASERTMVAIQARKRDPGLAGIETGFLAFDRRTGGLRRGCLYCIAGRPGHGKTALALDMALNVAADGHAVVFVSCEMPTEQLVVRAIAKLGGIDCGKLETGELDQEGWSRATKAAEIFSNLPLAIDDRPAQTASGVRAAVRRGLARLRNTNQKIKIGLVVVDYIQIMRGERRRGDSREQEVAELSKSMMWLAKELDCPVFELSQLNRESTKRPGDYRLSDLRESGAIEQDCFGVFFVHRDDADERDESKHDGTAQIITGKLRQGGSTGIDQQKFHGPSTRFFDTDIERASEEFGKGFDDYADRAFP